MAGDHGSVMLVVDELPPLDCQNRIPSVWSEGGQDLEAARRVTIV
jgi:hypothetical protein